MYMLYTRKKTNTFYPQNYWSHHLTSVAIVLYNTEHVLWYKSYTLQHIP